MLLLKTAQIHKLLFKYNLLKDWIIRHRKNETSIYFLWKPVGLILCSNEVEDVQDSRQSYQEHRPHCRRDRNYQMAWWEQQLFRYLEIKREVSFKRKCYLVTSHLQTGYTVLCKSKHHSTNITVHTNEGPKREQIHKLENKDKNTLLWIPAAWPWLQHWLIFSISYFLPNNLLLQH